MTKDVSKKIMLNIEDMVDDDKELLLYVEDVIHDYRKKPSEREKIWKDFCRLILNDEGFALMFPNG
jgi:hypothetical protein